MALIDCPECATKVSDKAANCPSCGYPIAGPTTRQGAASPAAAASYAPPPTVRVSKSRGVYIMLGLLFGPMGFHNFYSGHNVAGAIKVAIFLIAFAIDAMTGFYSAFSLVVFVIFAIWALFEIIVVKKDARGNALS